MATEHDDQLAKRDESLKKLDADANWVILTAFFGTALGFGTKIVSHALNDSAIGDLSVVAGPIGNLLVLALRTRFARRAPVLVEGYVSGAPGVAATQLAEELTHKQRDEEVQNDVHETFRRMDEALDDSIVFVLGRLLRQQVSGDLQGGRRFFRNFGRLLCELDAQDLVALRDLLRKVDDEAVRDPKEHDAGMCLEAGKGAASSPWSARLLHLLKRHDFATESPHGGFGGVFRHGTKTYWPGPDLVILDVTHAKTMLNLVTD